MGKNSLLPTLVPMQKYKLSVNATTVQNIPP